jgi:hypothetical protein
MFSSFSSGNASGPAQKGQPSNKDDSMSGILPSPRQKIELARLVLFCTDAMKKDLLSTFEVSESVETRPSKTIFQEDFVDVKETNEEIASKRRLSINVAYSQQQRREHLQELESSNLQGLKRAATTHFEAWRARVLRRVCSVLGVTPDQVKRARKEYVEVQRRGSTYSTKKDTHDWAVNKCRVLPTDESETIFIAWTDFREYSTASTSLTGLEEPNRQTILNACLSLLLSLESYSAHSRILMLHLATSLNIEREALVNLENRMARSLVQAAAHLESEEYKQKEAANNATSNKWKVGLATVAGAALIGVTGGLAAPFLAAGIGSVFGALGLGAVSGLLGVLAGNTVLIAGLFGAYGAKMTGKMVEELSKDVEDFKFIPVRVLSSDEEQNLPPNHDHSKNYDKIDAERQTLRVAIGVPGSMVSDIDIPYPAYLLTAPSTTVFALRWEIKTLIRLGVSLNTVLRTYIWETARFELLRRTLFASLAAGLWPLGLVKLATVIDNPFNIARARADKAGKILAATLIGKAQGERPVTLVGWGVGARVIYACLTELARQNMFGVVENAVLVGTPAPSRSAEWTRLRAVVSGRLVNVYSEKDLLLGFLYRANTGTIDVAGLQPVLQVQGVENINVSDLVDGHTKYRLFTGKILKLIGFEDVSEEGLAREEHERKQQESMEKASKASQKEQNPEKEAKAVQKTVIKVVHQKVGAKDASIVKTSMSQLQHRVDLWDIEDEVEPPPSYDSTMKLDESAAADVPAHSYSGNLKTSEPLSRNPESAIASSSNVDVEDLASDNESDVSEDLQELDYLDPEPISDSELDLDENVSFGDSGSGFNLAWKGKHGR